MPSAVLGTLPQAIGEIANSVPPVASQGGAFVILYVGRLHYDVLSQGIPLDTVFIDNSTRATTLHG